MKNLKTKLPEDHILRLLLVLMIVLLVIYLLFIMKHFACNTVNAYGVYKSGSVAQVTYMKCEYLP